MSITITGVPVIAATPGFAGDSIRVPLSAEPSAIWLDQLRRQELPGKAHRVDGAAIEFYLDHDTRDVIKAMQRIAKAIEATDQAFDEEAAAEVEAAIESQADDRRRRIERLLQQWWDQEVAKRERLRLRAEAAAGAAAAGVAESSPAAEAESDTSHPSGEMQSPKPADQTEEAASIPPTPDAEAAGPGADASEREATGNA